MTHDNPAHWAVFDDVHTIGPGPITGVPVTWVPPINRDYEIAFISVNLHCGAAAADRYVYFSAVVHTLEIILAWFDTPATAGTDWRFTLAQGLPKQVNASLRQQTHPLPQRLRIPPNHYLYIRALNLDTGDTFTGTQGVFNMWVKSPI